MKVGVIGTGSMGQNHVRVLRSIQEVSEIIISDLNYENLISTAKNYLIPKYFQNHEEMLETEKPDAVIVATPPFTHKDVSLQVLKRNIPLLLEKPISHSIEDAQIIIDAAQKSGVVFTIGHVERFNPVISQIKSFLESGFLNDIYLINTHRTGPFPKRLLGSQDGVLIDLATHDFDIIYYLSGKITSVKSQVIKTNNQEIYARTLMELENGVKASSEFSWVSPRYLRNIEIYGSAGMLSGDYYNQEVTFFENSDFDYNSPLTSSFLGAGLVTTGKIIKYPLFKQEPLLLELKNFINSINGMEELLVKPEEALIALESALNI